MRSQTLEELVLYIHCIVTIDFRILAFRGLEIKCYACMYFLLEIKGSQSFQYRVNFW